MAEKLFRLPSQLYHYIESQYGIIGLIVAGLLIVVAVAGVYVWWDRRK